MTNGQAPQPPEPGSAAAATAVQQAVSDVPANGHVDVVVFNRDSGGAVHGGQLNPSVELADRFRGFAIDAGKELAEREVMGYSAGRLPSAHEAARLSAAAVPGLAPAVAAAAQPEALPLYTDDIPGAPAFYEVAVALGPNRKAIFLRAMTARSRVKRRGVLAAVLAGAAYNELQSEPLLFDGRFDAAVVDGTVVVDNQWAFERAFDFLTQARQVAEATVTTMIANLEISGREGFVDAAKTDVNMVAKLRSVKEKMDASPAYAEAMTMAKVVPYVEAHPELGLDLELVDGEKHLVFKADPQHRWKILKLLDDDFLQSELTESQYDSNSKSKLS